MVYESPAASERHGDHFLDFNTKEATLRTLSLTLLTLPAMRVSASATRPLDSSSNPDVMSVGHIVPSGGKVPFAKNARRYWVVQVDGRAVDVCC